MDRFFQDSQRHFKPEDLHLIGIACMMIASKFEEVYSLDLDTVYEKIAHKKIKKDSLKNKEIEICSVLNFDLCGSNAF